MSEALLNAGRQTLMLELSLIHIYYIRQVSLAKINMLGQWDMIHQMKKNQEFL